MSTKNLPAMQQYNSVGYDVLKVDSFLYTARNGKTKNLDHARK